jgi:hypothetical protein
VVYLVPFEVVKHTTKFLREGIKYSQINESQREQLEEQVEDPETVDYEAEQVNRKVFSKDTDRAILRNLMENGIRNAQGSTIGKSIIFARNHLHAVQLKELFDELYPQFGGKFCAVIDNYEPRAEQLIDDLKSTDGTKELTLAISVDIHCGLPGGNTDHFMQNQLSTFRRGRLAGMPMRIQFYKAADKFRDTGEHEALPHQRYLITDQFAFDLGRGMDFLDPNTLKNRDGKFGFAHPTELANALQSIPVPSLPPVSV